MKDWEEEVMKRMGMKLSKVVIWKGEMGFGEKRKYDIEVWLKGKKKYREI